MLILYLLKASVNKQGMLFINNYNKVEFIKVYPALLLIYVC